MKYLDRYLEFIIENVSSGKMRIYYSNEFRDLLNRISITNKDDNRISNFLIHTENSNQALDNATLIDITDKNDMISFIQVNRIKRKLPETGENLDYRILDKSKGSEFWKEGRSEIGIGRWLRRVAKDVHKSSISDSDVEKFVNQYKSAYDSKTNPGFELVSGEDIRKWYHMNNYETNRGQLGNSCMRYNRCQDYLDIYVNNPEVCKLLILKSDNDKIKGRALIWKLTDGTYFQDRIYTNYDSDSLLFTNWASERNYLIYSGLKKIIEVQLGDLEYYKYPYMDTFICYNLKSRVLSSDEDLWPGIDCIKLQDTNGGYESGDVVWSDHHYEYIQRDSAVLCRIGYGDETDWVFRDDAIYLEYKDEWFVPNDYVVWSGYHEEHFHIDDAVYSYLMNDSLNKNDHDVIEIQTNYKRETDWVVKSRVDLYIEINGEYYYRQDYIKDPYTGEYHFKDEVIDGVEFSKYIEDKIQVELGLESVAIAKERLIDIYKRKAYDTLGILHEIESNQIFKKSVRGIYWGFSKENLPTAEDMVPLLFSYVLFNDIVPGWNIDIEKICDKLSTVDSETSTKYKYWYNYDRRIVYQIVKMLRSINLSQLGDDAYKICLFLEI
jgi:hypothetical protein